MNTFSLLRRQPFLCRSVLALSCLTALPAFAASIHTIAVDKTGAEMADVVVYATPTAGMVPPAGKLEAATISQQELQFTPYVTVVRTGTEIKFPNNDKIEHHVKSFSAAKEFELKIYEKGTPPPVLFDKPGVVIAYCLLHGWMRAYVKVVETPYFGKTNAAGIVSIDNLPEGSYELTAWHPDMGTVKPSLVQTVQVGVNAVPPVRFAFDFTPRKRKAATVRPASNSGSQY